MYIYVKPDCPTKLLPAVESESLYIYLCTKSLEGALFGNINPFARYPDPTLLGELPLLRGSSC